MKIAAVLTCFNRKDKTVSCLRSLYKALDQYNAKAEDKIQLAIYLTDDGCTDGTADAVREDFGDKEIHILRGDGNLFWAGGMRLAWREALKRHEEWDYYLLLNDDTDILEGCFGELFNAEAFSKENYGLEAVVSGICSAKDDHTKMTYGGNVWINRFLATSKRLDVSDKPQMVDLTNANILLVPKYVVDKIGIFPNEYVHGSADYDYAVRIRRAGLPLLITAGFAGACDNDHDSRKEIEKKVLAMTRAERKKYYSFPPHSGKDYLHYYKANFPIRYPLVLVGHFLSHHCPKIYYWLDGVR